MTETEGSAPADGTPPPWPSAAEAGSESPTPAPPAEREIAIRTEGLTKFYDRSPALEALDLEIRAGDIFGYIGPNGAGKTTTIRILAGLLRPSSGRATVHGIDVLREPLEIKKLVGYMPDSFGVYDNMSLEEYLTFFAAAYKIPRAQRATVIRDVLELTDLGQKRRDEVNAFSRGMKQRACLAKTLLHDPKVLILDEPASGLDPRARIEFRELLRELQRMGKTILVSSHILTELSTICNTIGIIEKGKLITSGAVDDILANLQPVRRYRWKALDEAAAAAALTWIAAKPGIDEPSVVGRELLFGFRDSAEAFAELLAEALGSGLRLVALKEEIADLETAFMTLTRGELN